MSCGRPGRQRIGIVGRGREQHSGRIAEGISDSDGGGVAARPGEASRLVTHRLQLCLDGYRDCRRPTQEVDRPSAGKHARQFCLCGCGQRCACREEQWRVLLRGKWSTDQCIGVVVGTSQYDGTSTTRRELGLRCGNGSCETVGTGEPVDVHGRTTRIAASGGTAATATTAGTATATGAAIATGRGSCHNESAASVLAIPADEAFAKRCLT